MATPKTVLIMPDSALTGRDVVEAVTSEADRFVGPVVIGEDNDGDLLPLVYGTPTSDFAIQLAMTRAGASYKDAEWRWKNATDPDSGWRGIDQVNWLSNPHDPFAGYSGYRTCLAACFAKRLNTIFSYWLNGSGTLLIAYRPAGSDPTSWTLTSFVFTRPVVSVTAGGVRVIELPDGALRMFVVYGHVGINDNDVDVYHSTDGITWTLASRQVLAQAGGGSTQIQTIKAASSGDWIRIIVCIAATTQTYVSSDRGASFTKLSNLATAIPTNGQTADPYSLVDLIGTDDYSGTFLMFYNALGVNDNVYLMVASRDEDWAAPSLFVSPPTTGADVYRISCVKTPTHIMALTVEWDGTHAPSIGALFVERNIAANGNPDDYGYFYIAGTRSADMMPRSLVGCEADGGAMIMYGRCDQNTSGAEAEYGGAFYVQQWTGRSAWEDEIIDTNTTDIYVEWNCILGDAGDYATDLITGTGASATRTWSSDYVRLKSNANGNAGKSATAVLPGGTTWADGGNFVAEWIVRQPSGGVAGSDDRTAVRIKGIGTAPGSSFDFSVRHLPGDSVVLYDNGAARTMATLPVALVTYFQVGRACVTVHDGATWAEIAFCRTDQLGYGWTSTAGTLSVAAAGVTAQMVIFGNVTGLAGTTSDWRSFKLDKNVDWSQAQFTNPTSLRGAPASAKAWFLSSGAHVEFSGGSAFEFDSWSVACRHRHEVENLFLPSPQAGWRSTSMSTQQIVFDAANVNRSAFRHGGALLAGLNVRSVRVAYNTANSWSAPAVDMTLTSDIVTGLSVSAVDPSLRYVEVAGATLDEGAYVGKWLAFTGGAWSGASITIASQSGQRLYFEAPGWTSAAMATNDTCVIHGSVACSLYSAVQGYRYMLVQTSQQTTAAGYHEIGSLIAGVTFGFDAAELSWEHGFDVLNGVEITDGIGGVRWGFEASPPRRTWSFSVEEAIRKRQKFESVARGLARLSVRPIGFIHGDVSVAAQLPKIAVPARYVGDVKMQNVGYRQVDATWYEVGAMDFRFDEEL